MNKLLFNPAGLYPIFADELLLSAVLRKVQAQSIHARLLLERVLALGPAAKICFGGGELLGDKSRSCASYTELLFRHSLVPYHIEFWCNEDQTNFFAGGAPLSKYLKNHFLKQIRFFNNSCPTLRLCKSCVGLEIEFLGTSFWHRKHQLPGVVSCHIHNCALYKSEIPNKFDYRLQNLKLPHQTKNLNCSSFDLI